MLRKVLLSVLCLFVSASFAARLQTVSINGTIVDPSGLYAKSPRHISICQHRGNVVWEPIEKATLADFWGVTDACSRVGCDALKAHQSQAEQWV
jgi:hypothetical protein